MPNSNMLEQSFKVAVLKFSLESKYKCILNNWNTVKLGILSRVASIAQHAAKVSYE